MGLGQCPVPVTQIVKLFTSKAVAEAFHLDGQSKAREAPIADGVCEGRQVRQRSGRRIRRCARKR